MTFAKLNFPIYISIHLFLHKKYELHFLVFFQPKKYTQKRFLWRVRMHTDTQTHNKYASNDLSEFHRFQPEDLYLKFCNKTSVKNNHFNRSILSLTYSNIQSHFPPNNKLITYIYIYIYIYIYGPGSGFNPGFIRSKDRIDWLWNFLLNFYI